ncbi:winged helix-turn-helix transcriptional regulator [Sporolactobacillus shoreicorticis]|uniref:Lrp/AsnC family transcriptional regulator n=1 Tax=Sporolactobacillus shoreicorticis TaxID=1923877 RepID=A0ABW5S6J3_9BACL|nr:winged helix-turn-helix transcriptional regulator [Sporolactobacillus shoreicorticis]MCO7126546.1 winged helix-turn-helix transcriptional regulator [Sporolactobacillus shoreicorticis]
MDEIDRKIICLLTKNSRLTWKQIGDKIHMTGQATGLRVQHMIEQGIIRRFTIDQRHDSIQFITVYMSSADYGGFEKMIAEHSHCIEAHKISGDGCYILKTCFPEVQMLDEFCTRLLRFGRYKVNSSIRQLDFH